VAAVGREPSAGSRAVTAHLATVPATFTRGTSAPAAALRTSSRGTAGAVHTYMRSWVVLRHFQGLPFPLPLFPGGTLVGLVLGINLLGTVAKRFDYSWQKSGLWLVHFGLILLVAGEFCTGAFQVETNMTIMPHPISSSGCGLLSL